MVTNRTARGFTLIELLVVIAIIGILASVVLASLNSARDKGADAAIKSSINNARAQAELYYDTNNRSYATLCTAAGGINNMLQAARNSVGGSATVVTANGTAGGANVVCHSDATRWATASPLVSATGYYCVDSTGAATTTTATLTANDYAC